MLKFLPGIIILQAVTTGLAYVLLTGEPFSEKKILLTLISLDIAFILVMALWFSALARQHNFAALESLKKAHAKEREKLRVDAEREKNKLADKKNKELLRETKRAHTVANIKTGSIMLGLVLLGGALVYSQFIAFGSILLTAGAGGLLGYFARAKQEKFFPSRKVTLPKFSNLLFESNAESTKKIPLEKPQKDTDIPE
ncbi:MAG: hypothetical protein D3920_03815 [Candidatus Electrothrix sp. AW2]|nr:hypothetical protein [Candidatus Electrothrix gigas]